MNDILNSYKSISLEEMSGIKLMNRSDTKFVTTKVLVRQLLVLAKDEYRVQEIDGKKIASYYTLYFDTDRYEMFRRHVSGHANRQKLRIRSYVDSNLNFLEVKTKDNHGRTRKKRIDLLNFDPRHPNYDIEFHHQDNVTVTYEDFLHKYLAYNPEDLHTRIENHFERITLVNELKTERLTIDMNLSFNNLVTGNRHDMGDIVIVELKRDGLEPSPVLELLRQLRIKPMGFSKYCIGTAYTNERLRNNLFKPKVHKLERLLAACN